MKKRSLLNNHYNGKEVFFWFSWLNMKLTLHLFGAAKTHAETPGLVDYEDTCKLSTVGTPSGEFC